MDLFSETGLNYSKPPNFLVRIIFILKAEEPRGSAKNKPQLIDNLLFSIKYFCFVNELDSYVFDHSQSYGFHILTFLYIFEVLCINISITSENTKSKTFKVRCPSESNAGRHLSLFQGN
jgi:hypothetical protein